MLNRVPDLASLRKSGSKPEEPGAFAGLLRNPKHIRRPHPGERVREVMDRGGAQGNVGTHRGGEVLGRRAVFAKHD